MTVKGSIISWNMKLLKDLLFTRSYITLLSSVEPIIFWFDEYNYRLSIEDKYTPGYLPLQQYPESLICNSDLLNLIPCEVDLTSTTFSDTPILKYKIELPHSGKKNGFNLLHDEYFTIHYITDTIPNSPASHQLPTKSKQNMWIVDINGGEPITA